MNALAYNYLFLGVISLISVLVEIEDAKSKKIRNKLIVAGFLAGFLLFLAAYGFGIYNKFDYLIKVIINVAISFLAGFAIWRLGFWSAGDAKLFILFSFLLPLYYYQKTFLDYFPSFVLIINCFIAFLIFLIFKSFYFWFISAVDLLKNKKIRKEFLTGYVNEKKNKLIGSFKNKKVFLKMFFKISVGLLAYLILAKFLFKSGFQPKMFFLFFLIFFAINALIDFYISKYSKEKIKIEDLQIQMNLAAETILKLKENKIFFKDLGVLRSEGIEGRQVNLIKDYLSKNNVKEVYIYKSTLFSLWIIIGALMTILLKGSVVQTLFNLI